MKHLFTVCFVAAALAPTAASAEGWAIETVAPFGVYFDIAVDASGTPHILFTNCRAWEACSPVDPGNAKLTYGTKVGSAWTFETAAGDPAGDDIHIILDGTGRPHVAYQDSTGQMHYGYRSAGGWIMEDLHHDVLNYYRASPSVVLDAQGEPHIAFIERERIRYAYKVGGVWKDEPVTGSWLDNWSARAAIAIDPAGVRHVGSWMYYSSAVYFTRGASAWTYELLGGDIGYNPWMVLDADGAAHFVYHGSSGVSYATNAGGSWVEELIDPEGINEPNDICLDASGRPVVAYSTAVLVSLDPYLYDVDLFLARREDGLWTSERIDSAEGTPKRSMRPRLDIDAFGTVHILYRHPLTHEMRYGTRSLPTAVEGAPPHAASILRIVPNPFAPAAEILFSLDAAGDVRVSVYDVRGRRVRTLVKSAMPGGAHRVLWDGRTDLGAEAPSGVYFVRLETARGADTRRAVLTR